ncbi:hypothetical protein EON64_13270 [archaeon]|nr:MAG: hypothetical protein EON64_13270 [archaeon]
MVCETCQERLSRVIVPDKWKQGARNVVASGAIRAGKTNRILAAQKQGTQWIPDESRCRICKSKVQAQTHYCNDCAHKKGICCMCGKKTLDTSAYRMSTV